MSEQASPRCVGTDANRNFNDHWKGEILRGLMERDLGTGT